MRCRGDSTYFTRGTSKIGIRTFLDEIVTPLLREIGERWEKNRWNPFQESVSSTVIRDYLVGIRNQMHTSADAPLLMGACLPRETHDLPLCILLLKAQLRGYRVYLISSSPAPGSIEQLTTYFKPQIVLLSAMSELPFTIHILMFCHNSMYLLQTLLTFKYLLAALVQKSF